MAAPGPIDTVKRRKYEKLHCQHCNRAVSISTWYIHYEKYFDSVSGKWREDSTANPGSLRPDFNFDQDSESSECENEVDDEFSFEDDGSSGNGVNVSDMTRCIMHPGSTTC